MTLSLILSITAVVLSSSSLTLVAIGQRRVRRSRVDAQEFGRTLAESITRCAATREREIEGAS